MRLVLVLALLLSSVSNASVVLKLPKVDEKALHDTVQAITLAKKLNTSLEIELDGEGGSVGWGYEIYDNLRLSKLDMTCIVRSDAMSMDAWLLEMIPCKRIIYPNALLVFHKPSVTDEDAKKSGISKERAAHIAIESEKWLCQFTSAATGGEIPVDECINHLDKAFMGLWPFNAKLALERKLVDEVASH